MADETLSEDDQKTVDAAVKELADARDQLQPKDTSAGDGNNNSGTDNSGNGSANTGNSGASDAPKTGDTTMPFAMLALAGLAAGTGVVTFRKKHNR